MTSVWACLVQKACGGVVQLTATKVLGFRSREGVTRSVHAGWENTSKSSQEASRKTLWRHLWLHRQSCSCEVGEFVSKCWIDYTYSLTHNQLTIYSYILTVWYISAAELLFYGDFLNIFCYHKSRLCSYGSHCHLQWVDHELRHQRPLNLNTGYKCHGQPS